MDKEEVYKVRGHCFGFDYCKSKFQVSIREIDDLLVVCVDSGTVRGCSPQRIQEILELKNDEACSYDGTPSFLCPILAFPTMNLTSAAFRSWKNLYFGVSCIWFWVGYAAICEWCDKTRMCFRKGSGTKICKASSTWEHSTCKQASLSMSMKLDRLVWTCPMRHRKTLGILRNN